MSSAAVVIGALRVNIVVQLICILGIIRKKISFVKDKHVELSQISWKWPNQTFGLATFRIIMIIPQVVLL